MKWTLHGILALMEAQAPEGRQSRAAYDAGQLLQHCSWSGAKQNVQINHASSHSPCQRVFSNDRFHGIAVQQQDAVTPAICSMHHMPPPHLVVLFWLEQCTAAGLQYMG